MKKIEKYNITSILTTTIIILDCEVIKTSKILMWETAFTLRRNTDLKFLLKISLTRWLIWFTFGLLRLYILPAEHIKSSIFHNNIVYRNQHCSQVRRYFVLDPSGPGNQGGHPHHVEQFQSHCHGTSHNHTLQWQIGQPSVFQGRC